MGKLKLYARKSGKFSASPLSTNTKHNRANSLALDFLPNTTFLLVHCDQFVRPNDVNLQQWLLSAVGSKVSSVENCSAKCQVVTCSADRSKGRGSTEIETHWETQPFQSLRRQLSEGKVVLFVVTPCLRCLALTKQMDRFTGQSNTSYSYYANCTFRVLIYTQSRVLAPEMRYRLTPLLLALTRSGGNPDCRSVTLCLERPCFIY